LTCFRFQGFMCSATQNFFFWIPQKYFYTIHVYIYISIWMVKGYRMPCRRVLKIYPYVYIYVFGDERFWNALQKGFDIVVVVFEEEFVLLLFAVALQKCLFFFDIPLYMFCHFLCLVPCLNIYFFSCRCLVKHSCRNFGLGQP
jgi:hypothetical protein